MSNHGFVFVSERFFTNLLIIQIWFEFLGIFFVSKHLVIGNKYGQLREREDFRFLVIFHITKYNEKL